MSSSAVQAVILSEDLQLQCFIRRFLIRRNWDRRQIRAEPQPRGEGSGEQWVRQQFLKELAAYRNRKTRAATCLIIATDADKLQVRDRIRWFETVCTNAGVPFRQADESIAFVVPKRNIETWLAYLRGDIVDEDKEYPRYANESECREDVAKLDRMCRQQKLEPEPPPSLMIACDEFRRIVK